MAEEFVCAACGKEVERDIVVGITECRACRRLHCEDCINEEGLCVKCSEEATKPKKARAGAR